MALLADISAGCKRCQIARDEHIELLHEPEPEAMIRLHQQQQLITIDREHSAGRDADRRSNTLGRLLHEGCPSEHFAPAQHLTRSSTAAAEPDAEAYHPIEEHIKIRRCVANDVNRRVLPMSLDASQRRDARPLWRGEFREEPGARDDVIADRWSAGSDRLDHFFQPTLSLNFLSSSSFM